MLTQFLIEDCKINIASLPTYVSMSIFVLPEKGVFQHYCIPVPSANTYVISFFTSSMYVYSAADRESTSNLHSIQHNTKCVGRQGGREGRGGDIMDNVCATILNLFSWS